MNLLCSFPSPISSADLLAHALRAIELGLEPTSFEAKVMVPVFLSPSKKAAVLAQKGARGDPARFLSEMAHAMRERHAVTTLHPQGGATDAHQRAQLLHVLASALEGGRIALVEGSTGIGKSRIMGRAALSALELIPKARVWIAVPTIAILEHVAKECAKVDGLPPAALLLGRNSFVSAERVLSALYEFEQEFPDLQSPREKVEHWLSTGAKPTTRHGRSFARLVPDVSHLSEDLEAIAPMLADWDCTAYDDDADGGGKVRADMLERANASPLVLCTHTMLALRCHWLKEEARSPFDFLLVDEAHELEAAVAKLLSADVSLFSLRAWFLKNTKLTRSAEAVGAIEALIDTLRQMPFTFKGRRKSMEFRLDPDAGALIRAALEPIRAILKGARNGRPGERKELIASLERLLDGECAGLRVRFSPKRRCPSLLYGPASANSVLNSIWSCCRGAGLVSATVAVPKLSGSEMTTGYMKAKLAIPDERFVTCPPIHADWVFSQPTLLFPDIKICSRLCFPGTPESAAEESVPPDEGEAVQAYEQWLDNVSNVLRGALSTARGGSLMLCNSFRDIQGLKSRLSTELRKRAIFHEKGDSVQLQRERFLTLAEGAERPVWFATGAAWTGIDLSDTSVPSGEDQLLTDLIVVRAPFGIARGTTHISRTNAFGLHQITIWEGVIRLRQGIGRLIRRNGVNHRRIWMLDGRLFDGAYPWAAPLLRVFDPYSTRRYFDANGIS